MSILIRRVHRAHKTEEPSGLNLSLTPSVNLSETEKTFLDAAANGNLAEVSRIVEDGGKKFNLNCVDYRGRSALSLAVEEEDFATISYLLGKCKLNVIEEALLNAIMFDRVKVAQLILNHATYSDKRTRLRLEFEHGFYDQEESASSFSPDITPIVLAAQNNQFDITHMLLQQGFTIDDPHTYFCVCTECKNHRELDKVVHSRTRLNAYRGLCSPAYMCLSSDDPILVAFERSKKLERLADREKESKHEYKILSQQCKKFAVDMLDLCRSHEEVMAAIYGESNDVTDLTRMKLAIRYEQKNFIAHSSLQEHLSDIWYNDLPWFRHLPVPVMVFVVPLCMSLMPLMALVYFFAPNSKTGRLVSSPLVKFLNHSAAYIAFLVLLFIATTRESLSTSVVFTGTDGIVTLLILAFICGFFWTEIKQIWSLGLREYVRDMWNFMDMTMLCLYLSSYGLEGMMFAKKALLVGFNEAERYKYGDKGTFFVHPRVLSITLFSVANVLSFARVAYMLPASESFGQLQISYGRMLKDVAKFMFVYLSVMLAFMCGLTSLYSMNKNQNEFFNSLEVTFGTLFFAAFGMGDSKAAKVIHKDYGDDVLTVDDYFVEYTGSVLYGVYIIGAVVVLVNMLIAMMSNTFDEIRDDEDVEWKFARARLWLSYMERGATLPVPVNVIPTPKTTFRILVAIKNWLCSFCGVCAHKNQSGFEDRLSEESETGEKSKYKEIMHRVVMRYINNMKFEKKKADHLKEEIHEARDDLQAYLTSSLNSMNTKIDKFTSLMEDIAALVEPTNGRRRFNLNKRDDTEESNIENGDKTETEVSGTVQGIRQATKETKMTKNIAQTNIRLPGDPRETLSVSNNSSDHHRMNSSGSSARGSDDRLPARPVLKSRQQLRLEQEGAGMIKTPPVNHINPRVSTKNEIMLLPSRLNGNTSSRQTSVSPRPNDTVPVTNHNRTNGSKNRLNLQNGGVGGYAFHADWDQML